MSINATGTSLVNISMLVGVSESVSVPVTSRLSAPGHLVAVKSFSMPVDLFAATRLSAAASSVGTKIALFAATIVLPTACVLVLSTLSAICRCLGIFLLFGCQLVSYC